MRGGQSLRSAYESVVDYIGNTKFNGKWTASFLCALQLSRSSTGDSAAGETLFISLHQLFLVLTSSYAHLQAYADRSLHKFQFPYAAPHTPSAQICSKCVPSQSVFAAHTQHRLLQRVWRPSWLRRNDESTGAMSTSVQPSRRTARGQLCISRAKIERKLTFTHWISLLHLQRLTLIYAVFCAVLQMPRLGRRERRQRLESSTRLPSREHTSIRR